MYVQHRMNGAEHVLARILLILDIRFGQAPLVALVALDRHAGGILHAIEAIDTRLHGNPLQEVNEPPWRDPRHLWRGLCGIGELPRGGIAKAECTPDSFAMIKLPLLEYCFASSSRRN